MRITRVNVLREINALVISLNQLTLALRSVRRRSARIYRRREPARAQCARYASRSSPSLPPVNCASIHNYREAVLHFFFFASVSFRFRSPLRRVLLDVSRSRVPPRNDDIIPRCGGRKGGKARVSARYRAKSPPSDRRSFQLGGSSGTRWQRFMSDADTIAPRNA